jgi:hypothetical protein
MAEMTQNHLHLTRHTMEQSAATARALDMHEARDVRLAEEVVQLRRVLRLHAS